MKKKATSPAERSAKYRAKQAKVKAARKLRLLNEPPKWRWGRFFSLFREFPNEALAAYAHYLGDDSHWYSITVPTWRTLPPSQANLDYLVRNGDVLTPVYKRVKTGTRTYQRLDLWNPGRAVHTFEGTEDKKGYGKGHTFYADEMCKPSPRDSKTGLALNEPMRRRGRPVYQKMSEPWTTDEDQVFVDGRSLIPANESPPARPTDRELYVRFLRAGGLEHIKVGTMKVGDHRATPTDIAAFSISKAEHAAIKARRRSHDQSPGRPAEFASRCDDRRPTRRIREVAEAFKLTAKQYTPQPAPIPASSWGRYSEHAGHVPDFADFAEYINNEVVTPAELRAERGADDDAFDEHRGADDNDGGTPAYFPDTVDPTHEYWLRSFGLEHADEETRRAFIDESLKRGAEIMKARRGRRRG